ncbi:cupin domain-containing protein [Virgibacillus ihumii]|uniref:cupin domain-containing protein n=1 Tax=Virgibacillus ihumii TaxID=2686091 RepID=UPI00157D8220|nr:cupin domain-containing protein [Virgibacillus ihumii]
MQVLPVDHTIAKPKQGSKIFQEEHRQIMHIKLKEGEEIKEHDSPKHVFIFVKSGEVEFTVSGEPYIISTEKVLYMEPYERHALKALSDVSILVMKC